MKSLVLPVIFVAAVMGASTPAIRAAESVPNISRGTFVIVHGAWGAGYEWKEVGKRLRAEGFDVYRPTMTGMGERAHLSNPDIDLETHIMDIVNTILFEDLHDVILVGHSYGGMVITGVADRVPDRFKKIVYVDAFLPDKGQSANDTLGGPGIPPKDGFVHPMWNPAPSPPPHAMPQPAKTFSQPVKLEHQDAVAKIATTYVLTVDPGKKPEEDMFFRFSEKARARDWKVITMESDHVPQFSRIPEIVNLLAQETK
ncbi:MAG TPA: alpha/beta hydrolase [Opitutaceae bacterium]|nr:alpha/beta hydrolase [Opitutaceae bacterium]